MIQSLTLNNRLREYVTAKQQLTLLLWLNLRSCVFPLFIFASLALTKVFPNLGIPRYDLLLALCLGMQWAMYKAGWEEKREVAVICIFHALGLAMEIFKVSQGSWSYPEFAYSKIFEVPLYSGFMYASVASFVCQAWNNFNLKSNGWPALQLALPLAGIIYLNFYTNAFLPDARLILIPLVILCFKQTQLVFTIGQRHYEVSLLPVILGLATLVWSAENIATSLGAYSYPHQALGWNLVKLRILSSWFLLIVVSITIIAAMKGAIYSKFIAWPSIKETLKQAGHYSISSGKLQKSTIVEQFTA